jgi:enamine deaminase RidA (YjgF/YER057c/UK114 family)
MTIKRIHSGGPFEEKVGYCRAVVAGGWVHVAGCCAHVDDMPCDVVGQCKSALGVINKALRDAETDMAHVVRVVYYMTDIREFEACWPTLREAFGPNPPAATVIEAKLIDPADRIEIEVTAIMPESD